ncbi:unnamed protein product [Polarella glacialis]|uniref:C3H1-type domain-containing protein n=1 Tax=Polarella glacialis TaxID=89957 RepID=A0A813GCL1_POLGL|nr:unnamed protein product [Polarella glacialis]
MTATATPMMFCRAPGSLPTLPQSWNDSSAAAQSSRAEKGLKDRVPLGLNICIPEEEELFSTPAFSELPPWRRAAAENTSQTPLQQRSHCKEASRWAKLQIPKAGVHVRNTFTHIGAPNLEADGFHREHAVVSCPGNNVGRLRQLFQESIVPTTPELWRNATPLASQLGLRLDDALADTVPSTPEAYAVSGLTVPAHYLDSPPDLSYQQGFMGESMGMQHAQDACPYYQHHAPAHEWHQQAFGGMLSGAPHQEASPWYSSDFYGNVEQVPPQFHSAAPSSMPPRIVNHEPVPAPSYAAPGSEELPSLGSAGHVEGICKPCAFLHTKGCNKGAMCRFCHLCVSGGKKRRQKVLYCIISRDKRHALKGGA